MLLSKEKSISFQESAFMLFAEVGQEHTSDFVAQFCIMTEPRGRIAHMCGEVAQLQCSQYSSWIPKEEVDHFIHIQIKILPSTVFWYP